MAPSVSSFLALDAALLGEQRHGTHEVLDADDADDASALGDGNEGEAAACGEAADGGTEGVFRAGDLEGAGHDGLDVAIAVAAEGIDDALAGDDADQLRTADDGEVLLQGVDTADEGVGEGVRGGECGEVSEHDLAHLHGVNDGLEEDALVFNLGADHDEEAGDDEPWAAQVHAADHGGNGEQLTDAGGSSASGSKAVLAGKSAAQKPAGIERIGGYEVEDGQACLHPDHAAQEVGGGDPGLVEEAGIAAGAENDGSHGHGGCRIGDRAGKGHGELANALIGVLLAFRIGIGEESADGEQEHGAEAQAETRGDDEAGGFADEDGEYDDEEEAEAARPAFRGADAKADEGEQREKGVDTQLDAHPTAQRN